MAKIIVIRESLGDSLICDGVTYGGMLALLMVNHFVLGDNSSWVIDALGVILIIASVQRVFGKSVKVHLNSPKELLEYAEKECKYVE